jgi:hypothetical protein
MARLAASAADQAFGPEQPPLGVLERTARGAEARPALGDRGELTLRAGARAGPGPRRSRRAKRLVWRCMAPDAVRKARPVGILRLALLAPDIVEAILTARTDQGMVLEKLERPLPAGWDEQRKRLGC